MLLPNRVYFNLKRWEKYLEIDKNMNEKMTIKIDETSFLLSQEEENKGFNAPKNIRR